LRDVQSVRKQETGNRKQKTGSPSFSSPPGEGDGSARPDGAG
jgi:hypothetical protein